MRKSMTCLIASGIAMGLSTARAETNRVLLFTSPGVTTNNPAAGLYVWRGKTVWERFPLNPYRGSMVLRLKAGGAFSHYGSYVSTYPAAARPSLSASAAWTPGPTNEPPAHTALVYTVEAILRYAKDGNILDAVKGSVTLPPGQEVHAVWTWSGIEHRMYLNGRTATVYVANSPFPADWQPPVRLLHDLDPAVAAKAGLHEIAIYNFALTPEEVARDAAATDAAPLLPEAGAPGTVAVTAQWAPGEKRAYVAADAGNRPGTNAVRFRLEAVDGKDRVVASAEAPAPLGFAEALLAVPDLAPGTWRARARLLDADGKELAAGVSPPWTYPADAPWLGNTLGLSDKVQPPWTPVEARGRALSVWGRTYDLAGGFGLPQRIASQGRDWLAEPVRLELTQSNQPLRTVRAKVDVVARQDTAVAWKGQARMGDVQASVRGRLEYDGMMLITLRLEPAVPGRAVPLDAVTLTTAMPKERALFLNTSTDQGYWWYPYTGWIPEAPGLVHDNLRQRAARTSFLFYALFSDHETGLEWFADNLAGWQVDDARPVQEITRETNGGVRLVCRLANKPFVLDRPIEMTFGYDAAPVKPLPADWRSYYCHHHALKDIRSDLAVWWLWSSSTYDKYRPNCFSLRPDDLENFAKAVTNVPGIKPAPFCNQHVTLPAGPDRQREGGGWPWFINLLGAECENDGWTALPTRGVRDYWAWNFDQWIKSGGMQAVYIDEAGTQTVGCGLLSGSGYLNPDGTHAYGHNTLGMREQIKRVRQLFLDNGKRPVVWIPVYRKMIPHAYAFVDVVCDGEAFWEELKKGDGPDWMDVWGQNLLRLDPGKQAIAGPWLLTTGQAQKIGLIPAFLNYLPWGSETYYRKVRSMYGVLGLLDIIPITPDLGWFFKAKQDFGVDPVRTSFHGFYSQKEIVADAAEVGVSYYRAAGGKGEAARVLAIVSNLSTNRFEGRVTIDARALGLGPQARAARLDAAVEPSLDATRHWIGLTDTEVKREPLELGRDGVLPLTIPPHDFRLIAVE